MRHFFKPAMFRGALRNIVHWLRLPDSRYYTLSASRPLFRPYKTDEFRQLYAQVAPYTLVSPDRAHVLLSCARQATAIEGDFIECGVYQGGTAMLIQHALGSDKGGGAKRLLLFDTFAGMPQNAAPGDSFQSGELAETSFADVMSRLAEAGNADVFKGFIPDTFAGLQDRRFAFAHVDVDIYQSIRDCCEFIYPRLSPGGWMVFDDYGFPSCAGGKRAIDEFFSDTPEVPIVLPTGQALVVKLPASSTRN
jgi:O-methyltransferase